MEILDDGVGFAILDRLPLDRMTRDEAVAVYWLLCRMVARPVAQKWDGVMVYDGITGHRATEVGSYPGWGLSYPLWE